MSQVTDAKHLVRKLSQSGAKGQVEMLKDRGTQSVGVVTLWGEYRRDGTRIFLRHAADDFQTPLPNRRTNRSRMSFMTAKYVLQSFFANHLQSLSQAVDEVRCWCVRVKARLTGFQHALPVPIRPRHFAILFADRAFCEIALKLRPGGIIKPFCE